MLGIGLAGGSSVKNEGKILAKRLEEMRKARDARATEIKKEKVSVGASAGANAGNSIMNNEVAQPPSAMNVPQRPSGNPNKSNKKKKNKNRR